MILCLISLQSDFDVQLNYTKLAHVKNKWQFLWIWLGLGCALHQVYDYICTLAGCDTDHKPIYYIDWGGMPSFKCQLISAETL